MYLRSTVLILILILASVSVGAENEEKLSPVSVLVKFFVNLIKEDAKQQASVSEEIDPDREFEGIPSQTANDRPQRDFDIGIETSPAEKVEAPVSAMCQETRNRIGICGIEDEIREEYRQEIDDLYDELSAKDKQCNEDLIDAENAAFDDGYEQGYEDGFLLVGDQTRATYSQRPPDFDDCHHFCESSGLRCIASLYSSDLGGESHILGFDCFEQSAAHFCICER